MAQMSSCMGCGTPIPELLMDDGFNFRCTKCGCETRPQDTLEEAERLWNEGRIIPHNEEAFWKNIGNGREHIATLPAKKVYLSEHKVFEHGKWFENQTENKITDSKIMEALKCCYMPTQECANCPYKGKEDDDMQCFDILKRDALDLINRQKAEIERLVQLLDDKCDRCIEKERTEAAKEFANELYRVFAGHSDYHGDTFLTKIACLVEGKVIKCAEPIDTNKIKYEAIKEFAERLKVACYTYSDICGYESTVIDVSEINNLVKEMVGDTE